MCSNVPVCVVCVRACVRACMCVLTFCIFVSDLSKYNSVTCYD